MGTFSLAQISHKVARWDAKDWARHAKTLIFSVTFSWTMLGNYLEVIILNFFVMCLSL